jgi:hypothetical protein
MQGKSPNIRPFGHGGSAIEHGGLSHHLGWLEALAEDEEENLTSYDEAKAKRHMLVREAIDLLDRALNMGNEE